MIKWANMGKEVTRDCVTVFYEAKDAPLSIESRKRHIPHANGRSGTWDHTDFYLFKDGLPVCKENGCREFATLKAAKEYAEKLMGGD